ncbi:hypothetical protein OC846_006107, partial [Tilletia horrida]
PLAAVQLLKHAREVGWPDATALAQMTNKQFTTIALGSGFEAEARDIIDFASDEDQDVRGTGPLGPATEIRLIRLIRTEVERFETSLEPSKLQRLIQALVPEMTIRILSHFGVADAAGALVDVHAIHYGRLVSPLQTDVDSVVARDDGRLRDSIRDEQDEQTAHASAVEQLKQEQQEHASAVEQLSKEQQEHASAVEQLRTEQQEHVSAVERLQNVLLEVRQQNVGLQEAASAAQSDKNAIEDVLKKEVSSFASSGQQYIFGSLFCTTFQYELLANALAGWKVTLEYCNRMMEDNDSYVRHHMFPLTNLRPEADPYIFLRGAAVECDRLKREDGRYPCLIHTLTTRIVMRQEKNFRGPVGYSKPTAISIPASWRSSCTRCSKTPRERPAVTGACRSV